MFLIKQKDTFSIENSRHCSANGNKRVFADGRLSQVPKNTNNSGSPLLSLKPLRSTDAGAQQYVPD